MTGMIVDVLMGMVSVISVLVIMLALAATILLLVTAICICIDKSLMKIYDYIYICQATQYYNKIKPYNKNKE